MKELDDPVAEAAARLEGVASRTPLQFARRLSDETGARVYLKREDLQEVRSFKIRGAYNKIASLGAAERARGVVCASAGNHAQGVAYACARLGIDAVIYMPEITPSQKIERVKRFGGSRVEVRLVGDTYDAAGAAADRHQEATGAVFVHPFDDPLVFAGQGTVAREIASELPDVDVLVTPVGGGGLAAGIIGFLRGTGAATVVIGAEPAGAAAMAESIDAGRVVTLEHIDTFVDGAAVRRVGATSFEICREGLAGVVRVAEGKVCTTVIDLYQNEGIITEPAGALAVAALEGAAKFSPLAGRTVVCILSGGNNDILRYPEIMERSLVHQGRKHYFIVEFAQKPGQLRQFVDSALGPTDDIVRFEYMKKTNKERGAALIGVELRSHADLGPLEARMVELGINFRKLSAEDPLYDHVV